MKIDKIWTVMLLAAIAAAPAVAQNKDFTGTWSLNLAKSFMAGDHPPKDYELTRKIEQKDGTFSITDTAVHAAIMNIPLADSTTTMEFAVDGKAHDVHLPPPFPGMAPMAAKATAVWEGCTLQLLLMSGGANSTKQRLFKSEDGSELIILVEGHSNYGDTEQRLVFDKGK